MPLALRVEEHGTSRTHEVKTSLVVPRPLFDPSGKLGKSKAAPSFFVLKERMSSFRTVFNERDRPAFPPDFAPAPQVVGKVTRRFSASSVNTSLAAARSIFDQSKWLQIFGRQETISMIHAVFNERNRLTMLLDIASDPHAGGEATRRFSVYFTKYFLRAEQTDVALRYRLFLSH